MLCNVTPLFPTISMSSREPPVVAPSPKNDGNSVKLLVNSMAISVLMLLIFGLNFMGLFISIPPTSNVTPPPTAFNICFVGSDLLVPNACSAASSL